MHVRSLDCCGQFDLEHFRMMQELYEVENKNDMDFNPETLVLSYMAADLQGRIKLSEASEKKTPYQPMMKISCFERMA